MPTAREVARAVVRAEAGKSIDAGEAEALLEARGDELDRLMVVARRVRDAGLADAGRAGRDHVLAQGVHPADPAVPGPLPLLHVRHGARPSAARAGAVPVAGRGAGDRPAGRGAGLQGGAVHPGRPAGGPLAARRGRGWTRHGYDSTLEYVRAMAIRVLEETGLLPHLNPGVMSLGGDAAAQAGRAVDGDDAGDHVAPALRRARAGRTTGRRTRTRRSGCGCWRTPAG